MSRMTGKELAEWQIVITEENEKARQEQVAAENERQHQSNLQNAYR